MKKWYSKYIDFSSRWYGLIIILLFALMTGEFLYLKDNLKIDTDLKALFNGANETVIQLQEMEEKVGSYSTILVVASSPDREKNIQALANIKAQVKNNPAVRYVDFDRDTEYLEKHALLFASIEDLEKIKETIRKRITDQVEHSISLNDAPVFKEGKSLDDELNKIIKESEKYFKSYKLNKYYEAQNGTLVAMKVRPAGSETSINDTKKVVDLLDNAIKVTNPEKLGVRVEAGGPFRNKLKEMKAIYDDVFSTLAICIVLLFLIIIYYFRSFRSVFIVFLPLSAGVLTAVFTMQYFIGGFNIISAFSFSILYGLGIDFSIHLLGRFSEERERLENCKDAMISSYSEVIPAIFAGAVTTVAAFLSLTIVDFKGFSDFGLAAAIGVSAAFISTIVFFPPVIFFFEKFKPVKLNIRKTLLLSSIYRTGSKRSFLTASIFILITVLAVISINFISMEYDFNNLTFPGKYDPDSVSTRYIQAVKKEKTDFMSTGLPSFILTNSKEETEDASRALDKIKKHNTNTLEFKDYISIYSFIPEKQDEKLKIIRDIRRLIERKVNLFDEKTIDRYNNDFRSYLEIDSPVEEK
ncbi:MAG TPA: MMPL family transporter, partial [bacterium]|nr:MMPL family transporter [bacterium]